jgi:DNA anti-recombination protein RmuC
MFNIVRTETVDKKFNQQQEKQKQLNQESSTIIKEKFSDFNQQQAQFNQQATDNIKHIEKTVGTQLTNIREESSKKLEQMRQTSAITSFLRNKNTIKITKITNNTNITISIFLTP